MSILNLFSKTKSGESNQYEPFVQYFNKKKIGSEMPVLTILSYLPPRDRCAILEYVLKK